MLSSNIIMWIGAAVFLGPIVAAIGLVGLRYQLEKGKWWGWLLLVAAIVMLYRWLTGPQSPLPGATPAPAPTVPIRRVKHHP